MIGSKIAHYEIHDETGQGGMRELCAHPDGRHMAFTAGQGRSETWLLENFLPGK